MITVAPTNEKIESCIACNQPNYVAARPRTTKIPQAAKIKSNGVILFDVSVGIVRRHTLTMCRPCLRELVEKIQVFV